MDENLVSCLFFLLFTSATVVYKDLAMYFFTFTICGV